VGMRLESLNLACCARLTSESIRGLLVGNNEAGLDAHQSAAGVGAGAEPLDQEWGNGDTCSELVDLSLYGDFLFPSPLELEDVQIIFSRSPAFSSSLLRTLDISSLPLTDSLLAESLPPQPNLIELGLANCPSISITSVATYLRDKAPGVEVLDLSNSCSRPQDVTTALIPTAPPLRLGLNTGPGGGIGMGNQRRTPQDPSLNVMSLHQDFINQIAIPTARPLSSYSPGYQGGEWDETSLAGRLTNLRVLELDQRTLNALQGGAGDWKIIKGKGRRSWYVDTSVASEPSDSSPTGRSLRKTLGSDPVRQTLLKLHNLNGSVSGDFGWRARKMEVMYGLGMMGREDGLYAFHSFQV